MTSDQTIEIVPVSSHAQVKEFIDLPNRLYRGNPAYVPRLFLQQKEQLSNANPYFLHSDARYFLARAGSETVGRIAWFLNNNHIAFSKRRELFFGFFDAVNNQAAADALLAVVHKHANAERCEAVLGPIEFSTNDTCGLLIEGFDLPPAILMPYNAPYYQNLLTRAGYEPVQELHAYEIRVADWPAFLDTLSGWLMRRLQARGITIRTMDFHRLDTEVESLFPVYEQVFSANWGYMPLSHSDFLHQAKDLRKISIPDFVLVAEAGGRAIGYAVGVFDANEVFAKFRNGRLLPFNVFRLRGINKVSHLKIVNLGVVPEYRTIGIDVVMYARIFDACRCHNIPSAEASYVMASNERMKSAIHRLNGCVTKRYAIYKRAIGL